MFPNLKRSLSIVIDGLSDQHFKTVFQRINNKNWRHNKKYNRICYACVNSSYTFVIGLQKQKLLSTIIFIIIQSHFLMTIL